jgi:hypothetical protein
MREDVVKGGLGHAGFLGATEARREGRGVGGRLLAGGVGVRLGGDFLLVTRKKQERGGIEHAMTLLLRESEFRRVHLPLPGITILNYP